MIIMDQSAAIRHINMNKNSINKLYAEGGDMRSYFSFCDPAAHTKLMWYACSSSVVGPIDVWAGTYICK